MCLSVCVFIVWIPVAYSVSFLFFLSVLTISGNPIEVMGILLGRPDPLTPQTLVVTDAFALPIEGFETRVIADDEDVVKHMISLSESLEATRKEKFMGWYHSHPFDLGPHSHCFLSQTDLTTQLQWPRAEYPHGNPFVALVVDPLRSMHTQQPELKAFRAYPPTFNSSTPHECPDGKVQASEQLRLEQWGSCWNRYYELGVEYYMSSTSRHVIVQGLTQDSLWMRTLVRAPPDQLTQQLTAVAKEMKSSLQSSPSSSSQAALAMQFSGGGPTGSAPSGSGSAPASSRSREWSKAVEQLNHTAVEQIGEATLQETKNIVFGS